MGKLFQWKGNVMDLGCGYSIKVERPMQHTRAVNLYITPKNGQPIWLLNVRLLDTEDVEHAKRFGLRRMYRFLRDGRKALNTDFEIMHPSMNFAPAAIRLALAIEFQNDAAPPEIETPAIFPEEKQQLLAARKLLCKLCKTTPTLVSRPPCHKCMVGILYEHFERDGAMKLPNY